MLFVGYRKPPFPTATISQNRQISSTITVGGSSSTSKSTASGRTTPSRTVSKRDSPKSSGLRASQKFNLANHANQIVSVVRPFDQCLESLIGVRHPEHVMPHRESRLRRISSRVRPVRMRRRRSISSADSGESRPAGGIPCASPSGRKNPITLPSQSHSSTACVASPSRRHVS